MSATHLSQAVAAKRDRALEFKRRDPEATTTQIAASLGVSQSTVGRWLSEAGLTPPRPVRKSVIAPGAKFEAGKMRAEIVEMRMRMLTIEITDGRTVIRREISETHFRKQWVSE